jgi:hypothetical protein
MPAFAWKADLAIIWAGVPLCRSRLYQISERVRGCLPVGYGARTTRHTLSELG